MIWFNKINYNINLVLNLNYGRHPPDLAGKKWARACIICCAGSALNNDHWEGTIAQAILWLQTAFWDYPDLSQHLSKTAGRRDGRSQESWRPIWITSKSDGPHNRAQAKRARFPRTAYAAPYWYRHSKNAPCQRSGTEVQIWTGEQDVWARTNIRQPFWDETLTGSDKNHLWVKSQWKWQVFVRPAGSPQVRNWITCRRKPQSLIGSWRTTWLRHDS